MQNDYVQQQYDAISNMPVADRTSPLPGTQLVRFQATPPMSTYLIAFILSDMPYLNSSAEPTTNAIPIRIFAPLGRVDQAEFGARLVFS